MKNLKYAGGAVLAAGALLTAASAQAETAKLTVVAAAPGFVTYVQVSKNKLIPEIDRRLAASGKDFKIEWTQAYAQTLAKFTEVFESVEQGIGHVGLILKNFEPANLPLEQYVTSVPFARHKIDQIVDIDAAVRAKVPAMNKAFLKHNQIYLTSGVNHSMQFFSTFPIRTVDDLKGRKIGASGAFGQWLRGTGAVTVSSSMNQSFNAIRNGIYEGYPISINLAFAYKTFEAAKHYTKIDFGASPTSAITVNRDTWNKFPAHVRQIFTDVSKDWGGWQVALDTARLAKFVGIMKKKGVTFSEMSKAERRRWAMQMPNIAQEWADRQEKKGLPGRAVMTAFMNELRARKVEMAREWDRE